MTWKSSCSIASDDDSFLSDCDSEFDLRPPPRYPAEKRSSLMLNKRPIGRIEPPMTRSRSKAMGKTLASTPVLPKTKRQLGVRRSLDSFTGFATTLKTSLQPNPFLLSKPESTVNERVPSWPSDGVNILADRFENWSLDEEQTNRNRVWPSRETNSHYMRPISSNSTFGASPFSTFNNSTATSSVFGQHQAQLWSRFRFAASALRNDFWTESTAPSPSFHRTDSLFSPLLPQSVPSNRTTVSDQNSLLRQRQPATIPDSISAPPRVEHRNVRSSLSKIVFILTVFLIGLVLGYLLTSSFPPGRLWKSFVHLQSWKSD